MKARRIIVLLIAMILVSSCGKRNENVVPLLTQNQPPYTLGSDGSDQYYKYIDNYAVDRNGKIYMWDAMALSAVDVYKGNRDFLFKFGKSGQGPEEYPVIVCLAVDHSGNIWINPGNHKSLMKYSATGDYLENVLLPNPLGQSFVRKMIFDVHNGLYLLCSVSRNQFSVYKYFIEENKVLMVHEGKSRQSIHAFTSFEPDMDMDSEGNIYVTDPFEYRITKYSGEGKILWMFTDKGFKKDEIVEDDFNVFKDLEFKVVRYEGYKDLNQLSKESKYLPAIFGINIDSNRIFVWTSKQDEMKRFAVDIYDLNFNKKYRSYYFNTIRRNLAEIATQRLYIPSIENENMEKTKSVGRLIPLNIPDRLHVYEISSDIYK